MTCWMVLIQKIWIIRQVERFSSAFRSAIYLHKNALLSLSFENLPKPLYAFIPHPYAHIYRVFKQKTVEILEKNRFFSFQKSEKERIFYLNSSDLESIFSYVETIISSENFLLEKNLFILPTIVTLAPFVGLLGTVWGILIAFGGLHSGESISSSSSVLGGISTALVTTVMGLLIAIPAFLAYNYLKNVLNNYFAGMQSFLVELIMQIELQYRKME